MSDDEIATLLARLRDAPFSVEVLRDVAAAFPRVCAELGQLRSPWVRCAERLPDTDREVEVTVLYPIGTREKDHARYENGVWLFHVSTDLDVPVERKGARIIAWAEQRPWEGDV